MNTRIMRPTRCERDIVDRLAEIGTSLLNMNDDRVDASKEIQRLREINHLRDDEIKVLQKKINFR